MREKKPAADRRKRLGQYFSGARVGELLVSLLPEDAGIASAADPMAGAGDLLRAAGSRAAPGAEFLGVEIDGPVAELCAAGLPGCRVEHADAFTCGALVRKDGWDLVITNPPYVRYQLQQKAGAVREHLRRQLERLPYLTDADRAMLLGLAEGYSGLSDLAVPSWILCAALVKLGGYLAIVAPDTWLSREYARPIQYLLAKSFDVLTIVKDVSGSWFEDASVRTCLLVARRRETAPLGNPSETLCIELRAEAAGADSLADGLSYDGSAGMEALTKILRDRPEAAGPGFTVSRVKTLDLFPYMRSGGGTKKWLLPEDAGPREDGHPVELLPVLAGQEGVSYISLKDLGIQWGQGLRTGANEFFYLTIDRERDGGYEVQGKPWHSGPLTVPGRNLVRALQNRAQAEGLAVSYDSLRTALLLIGDEAAPADLERCGGAMPYKPLGPSLSAYIASAEAYRNARGLSFKEYSAVAPNEKRDGEGRWLRFWYMLPPLARRHLPALCVNRVNAAGASCLYVPQSPERPIVVDANFVTLWGGTSEQEAACLALLNSTWSKCYLECLCTVMGGGALKVESSHMAHLRFPRYSGLEELSVCGRRIMAEKRMSGGLQAEIDAAVLRPFPEPERVLAQLRALLLRHLSERGARP